MKLVISDMNNCPVHHFLWQCYYVIWCLNASLMEVTLYGGKRQLLSFNKGYPIPGSMITHFCKKNQRAKRYQMIKMVRMHWLLISLWLSGPSRRKRPGESGGLLQNIRRLFCHHRCHSLCLRLSINQLCCWIQCLVLVQIIWTRCRG